MAEMSLPHQGGARVAAPMRFHRGANLEVGLGLGFGFGLGLGLWLGLWLGLGLGLGLGERTRGT